MPRRIISPVAILGLLCLLAAVGLHFLSISRPLLLYDDFQIVAASWTWPRTWDNLWQPANEHAMPLGRLTTYALVRVAGSVAAVPRLTAFQGPLALIVGMLLVFSFVRRELGHDWYGLVAMM